MSTPRRDPWIGARLGGRFELQALLARGGAGAVYRGLQHPLGRPVAVKVLREDLDPASYAAVRERFLLEAELASKLRHPNIVAYVDAGATDDGALYVVMELLQGASLKRVMDTSPLTAERAARLALDVARGLKHAHGKGLIHRDVKPGNVFVVHDDEQGERAVLVDFGLAKDLQGGSEITKTGTYMGTPAYMSPEQVRGLDQVGAPADIYALGCLLYRMVSGHPPFDAEGPFALAFAHVERPYPSMVERFPKAGIPPFLDRLVAQCMAKEPSERPDAFELCAALERFGAGAVASAAPKGAFPAGMLGAAVVLGGVGLGLGAWLMVQPYVANLKAEAPPPTNDVAAQVAPTEGALDRGLQAPPSEGDPLEPPSEGDGGMPSTPGADPSAGEEALATPAPGLGSRDASEAPVSSSKTPPEAVAGAASSGAPSSSEAPVPEGAPTRPTPQTPEKASPPASSAPPRSTAQATETPSPEAATPPSPPPAPTEPSGAQAAEKAPADNATPPRGTWEADGVELDPHHGQRLLAFVNGATPQDLQQAGVYRDGVTALLSNRPFPSFHQLADTRGVGPGTLKALAVATDEGTGSYTPGTRADPTSGVLDVDGVKIPAEQAPAVLLWLNTADRRALEGAGIYGDGIDVILRARPFVSLTAFGRTPLIGRKTVQAVVNAASE